MKTLLNFLFLIFLLSCRNEMPKNESVSEVNQDTLSDITIDSSVSDFIDTVSILKDRDESKAETLKLSKSKEKFIGLSI